MFQMFSFLLILYNPKWHLIKFKWHPNNVDLITESLVKSSAEIRWLTTHHVFIPKPPCDPPCEEGLNHPGGFCPFRTERRHRMNVITENDFVFIIPPSEELSGLSPMPGNCTDCHKRTATTLLCRKIHSRLGGRGSSFSISERVCLLRIKLRILLFTKYNKYMEFIKHAIKTNARDNKYE